MAKRPAGASPFLYRTQKRERQPPIGRLPFVYTSEACESISRILSARGDVALQPSDGSSSIWNGRRRPFQAAYLHRGVQPGPRWRVACSGSCRNGATWPYTPWGLPGRSRHRERRCALTAPFHPLPQHPRDKVSVAETSSRHRGGTALCCTCHRPPRRAESRLPVRKHGTLRCSDFPHPGDTASSAVGSSESDDLTHTPQIDKRMVSARSSGRRGLSCKKAQRLVLPSALLKGRPFLSYRRRSRCRDLRRR